MNHCRFGFFVILALCLTGCDGGGDNTTRLERLERDASACQKLGGKPYIYQYFKGIDDVGCEGIQLPRKARHD